MQAIVIDATGERGRLDDIPAPQAGPRDAVVRVTFAGINPIDWKVRDGHAGAIERRPFVLGQDFAGVVESVGSEMREVSAGDRVFGVARGAGAYAQQTVVTAGVGVSPFARIPDAVGDAVAAALPTPVLTAFGSLELLDVGPGTRLLIAGAGGSVGSAAVQIARSRGADITALVRPAQRDAIRALGATRTIDDIGGSEALARDDRYDAVLDVISNGGALQRYWAVLRAGGTLVSTTHAADVEWFAARDIRAANIVMAQTPQSSPQGLETIARWVADGTLRVAYSERDLADAPQILDDLAAGHAGGKIVLRVPPAG
ncbi:MAG TPA: NADP-dependent oxidoreductase [Candidatus Tumulicola sp.]|jgi:NADPH:quinone reductase-like Zn-dependent oxidoreductase